MKNFVIVLSAMLALAVSVTAQTNPDPTPLTMQTGSTNIYDLNFNSNKYVYGWNWGSEGRKVDSLFDINYYHAAVDPRNSAEWNSIGARWEIPVKSSATLANQAQHGLWGTKTLPDTTSTASMDYYDENAPARWLVNIHGLTSGSGNLVLFNAPAFTYFPRTNLNSDGSWTDPDIPYTGDPSGSVFGFKYKQGIQNYFNYVRLNANTSAALDNTTFISYSSNRDNAVLRDVYPNDKYYTINNTGMNGVPFYQANTTEWYKPTGQPAFSISSAQACGTQNRLSVSLKIYESLPAYDATDPNGENVVLKLKIRYTTFAGRTGYIKFSKATKGSIVYNKNERGLTRADRDLQGEPDVFDITSNMLRCNSISMNHTITLSAFFENKYGMKTVVDPITGKNKDVIDYAKHFPNPEFAFERYPNDQEGTRKDMIASYDIEVYYNPIVSVGIRYVRMGTENAYRLFWGEYDGWIQEALTSVEGAFDETTNNQTYKTKIHRYYANDEFLENYYAANRYYNKLLGGNVITERGYDGSIKEFNHCLEFKELWTGGNPVMYGYSTSPYIKSYVKNNVLKTILEAYFPTIDYGMYNPFGYTGGYISNASGATTNKGESVYETCYPGGTTDPFQHISYFNQYKIPWPNSAWIESSAPLVDLEKNYFACFHNSPEMLFGDKPYWANIWLHSGFQVRKLPTGAYHHYVEPSSCRTPTGEESKYMINLPMILGAKGILVWWKTTSLYGSTYTYNDADDKVLYTGELWDIGQGMAPYDFWYENRENIAPLVNLKGYDLLRHDFLGSDFLAPYNPPLTYVQGNYYPQKYNYNTIDNKLMPFNPYFYTPAQLNDIGVKSDYSRFYLGSTSIRSELYKNRQFILANEAKLMKLKLKFYRYKGFLTNDMKADDFDELFYESIFDFVKYSTIKNVEAGLNKGNDVKTRPLTRPITSTKPYEQAYGTSSPYNKIGIDSGFYDITILEEDGVPREKGFVMGIANRRTSPLIYDVEVPDNPNLANATDSLNALKFYSSDEFERGCQNGGSGFRTSAWWKKQLWLKQGCREITIPINNTAQYNGQSIVRIKELGIGTDLDSKWWRGADFIDLVNTTLIFDYGDAEKNLVIKLQPGETKLLQFEIENIYSNEVNLAYSNQHKLVCYPTEVDANGDPTKVRYHSVYHRKVGSGNYYDQFGVFYRRSVETTPSKPFEQIEWENEIFVSHTVEYIDWHYQVPEPSTDFSCRFPSLVVRNKNIEGTDTPTVYIVFEGSDKHYIGLFQIFETQIEANSQVQLVAMAKCLANYNIPYLNNPNHHYGKPVVNASANGNYYVWADTNGIQAAWKVPEDAYFANPNHKKLVEFNQNAAYYAHPSLNQYSRIDLGEDDAAMVWQESIPSKNNRKFDVMYSRLRIVDDALENYVPHRVELPEFGTVKFTPDSTTICLSCFDIINEYTEYDQEVGNGTSHEKPFLVRNIQTPMKDGNGYEKSEIDKLRTHWDRVYWEVHQDPRDVVTGTRGPIDLAVRLIDMEDDPELNPEWMNPIYPFRIYDEENQLSQPNASQYDLYSPTDNCFNNFALHFTSTRREQGYPAENDYNSHLWRIIHGNYDFWGSFDNNNTNANINNLNGSILVYNLSELGQEQGIGQYPHSAGFPFVRSTNNLINSRKVCQYGTPIPTLFSKKALSESNHISFRGYVDTLGNKQLVSMFNLSNNDSSSILSISSLFQNGTVKIDTFYTDWTNISTSDLNYLTSGSAIGLLAVTIERKLDGKIFNLTSVGSSQKKYYKHLHKLVNGGNQKYRFIVSKKPVVKSFYTEELELGSSFDVAALSTSTNGLIKAVSQEYEDLVDLGDGTITGENEMLVYPNPASDKLFVNLSSIKEGTIRVFSTIGVEQFSVPIINRTTQILDISNLTNGMFNIVVEYCDEIGMTRQIGKQIVISR